MVQLPAQTLRIKLDGPLVSMWEGGDVRIGEVWEVLARYLYLPRLRDSEVLLATAAKGPASMTWQSEGFATAGSFEASQSRYIGLTVGSHPDNLTMASLIVRPEFALGQLEQGEATTEGGTGRGAGRVAGGHQSLSMSADWWTATAREIARQRQAQRA